MRTPRPRLFRALGENEPPSALVIAGRPYRRAAHLKHDSWAATALYEAENGERVACKFNRVEPFALRLPAVWIGRFLAAREGRVLRLMHGIAGFPKWVGPVVVEGREFPNAVAHEWIEGCPFNPSVCVGDEFFPRLRDMVTALHSTASPTSI
ncbi:hypothetical protein CCR95_14975 [Thiocystis minor]|uniref:hypothetical protein n=1 Tax=Thiocystis minor TaxID=61597 RepID=UPI0019123ACF|nr:hypothetical protein [Thiocystis minor]MBK5965353.1 hypothetical protein [Thiocystis minor]